LLLLMILSLFPLLDCLVKLREVMNLPELKMFIEW
jgi:hypothetical protein